MFPFLSAWNGEFLWLNGVFVFGALAPGGAGAGEYSFSLGNLTATNYRQILREDQGGSTGWDTVVTAEEVPEPRYLVLLAAGLLTIGLTGRRYRKA